MLKYCRKVLKDKLKNYLQNKDIDLKPAGSSNGRTSPFEGEYLGSSPGPAGLGLNSRLIGDPPERRGQGTLNPLI